MRGSRTFKGGSYPLHKIHEGKPLTENAAIEPLAPKERVRIPMSQHIGAPAKPIVEEGEPVLMGQVIAEAQGFVGAKIHASVSGRIRRIKSIVGINGKPVQAIVIDNDFKDEAAYMPACDVMSMPKEDVLERIKQAGIVGMGGATFPTHIKLNPPEDKNVDILLINAAECEPFLTADHRLMLEHPECIVRGIRAEMHALGVEKAIVGIETNKPDAISMIEKACAGKGIEVQPLKTKYPQGSEKQLILSITGRMVPSGGLPADVGVVVSNIATVKAVGDAFYNGAPLIERVMTVTGAVKTPKNLLVRIGTPLHEVVDYVGGFSSEPLKIISGGPMMGLPVPTLDCVVTKGTSGLLVLDKQYTKVEKESNCIQCGKCADACPVYLMPMVLQASALKEDFERAEEYSALDCINCGNCSYVCPAKRPISQRIQFAKEQLLLNRLKEKEKKERD
ncbi:MAG: electron transport complex subunit RsxC [Christensenellaceae bacterium]|jgi:electron transport complex protein RnfC